MKTNLLLITLLLVFFAYGKQTVAQTIAGGGNHSLFVCTDGAVMACGINTYGQLGDGTTTNRNTPVQVNGLTSITAIVGGVHHSLFLNDNGTVWGYGSNYYGQLGDGTTTNKLTPVQVSGLTGITTVAGGERHSLFLKDDGTVWVCGGNDYGQFGDGTTTGQFTPLQVSGLTNVIAVASGSWHSLFLKNDGTVWGCGNNSYGQLGDGTTTNRTTPVQVSGLTDIVAVAGGMYHSLFLKQDGTVWECGRNQYGQLGDGTTTQRTTPVQVSGLTGITAVAGGIWHSLFLKQDGTVWGCGNNNFGQLGDGTTTKRTTPVQVSGLTGITVIAGGEGHSLFLKDDGTVWACGWNSYGQLGDGTTTNRTTPVQTTNLCQVAQPPTKPEYPHYIQGLLYHDANSNCSKETSEQGLSPFAIVAKPGNHHTFSNDSGYYSLGVNDSINYTITPIIPARFASMVSNPCPANYSIYLDSIAPSDTSGFDFGFDYNPCAVLRADVSSNRRRRCFRNTTKVYYINEGLADESNVKVHVQLPNYVLPVSASMAYTWSSDSTLVFDLGTLSVGQSGYLDIIDSVACINGITGLTQCTRAWITPANPCMAALDTAGGSWDKSSVAVEGGCIRDSIVEFVIYNTGDFGDGDMDAPSEYRIYADGELIYTGTFQLAGADSLVLQINAGGKTIRLEADQRPGHPGKSRPQETIEACGEENGTFSRSFVTQLPMDDEDLHVEEDCHPIIDSYDPNDKKATPEGITANNYVKPSTLLDYRIRFQNTGSDTAYKVVVVDTLSEHLNIATFEPGVSSFPYQLSLSGEGKPVLTFTLNNINLPDSATDELNSQGFVKFKIAPYDTVPKGTIINNYVDIFFDYNLPIRTNTAWITVHDTTILGTSIQPVQCDTTTAPAISFNTQDTSICLGESLQLEVFGADSYFWYEGDSIDNRNTSTPTVTPSAIQTYRVEAANNNSCYTTKDSVIVRVNLPAQTLIDTAICQGDSLYLEGAYQTLPNMYYDTLQTVNGCDSVIETNLVVNPVYFTQVNDSICQGDSLYLEGAYRTLPNTYYDTLQTVNGCDSVIETNLIVNPVYFTQINDSICQGDSLYLEGAYQTLPNIYYDTLQTVNGCDSVIETNLIVNPVYFTQVNDSICQGDSLYLEGAYQTLPNMYYDTLQTVNGCDSVIETNLVVRPSYKTVTDIAICENDSVLFGINYYNLSGTYYKTFQTSKGCDSVFVLNLTIHPIYFTQKNDSICEGDSLYLEGAYQTLPSIYYDTLQTVNGCDSVIETNLIVNPVYFTQKNDSICEGDSLYLEGAYQTLPNIYYDTLQTVNGCDSVIETNLLVNAVNTVVTLMQDTLMADAVAASYQWLDCSDNSFVGNNTQTYTATDSGYYAVIVSQNGCADTSTCYAVNFVGIMENDFGNQLSVFPNPTKSELNIIVNTHQKVNIEIHDINGKLMFVAQAQTSPIKFDLTEFSDGIYLLHVYDVSHSAVMKVVKSK